MVLSGLFGVLERFIVAESPVVAPDCVVCCFGSKVWIKTKVIKKVIRKQLVIVSVVLLGLLILQGPG